jgi:hypothetical protein
MQILRVEDLRTVSAANARSIIVFADEEKTPDESDAQVGIEPSVSILESVHSD